VSKIYLVGLGVKAGIQITLEAIQAIKRADKVYTIHSSVEFKQEIKKKYNDHLIDCASFFEGEKERAQVFRKIARTIIKEAIDNENIRIAFAVMGNPLFLVSACEYLIAAEEDYGISLEVISGVSTFDTVLSDLKIDVGYGAAMYDSTLFLSKHVIPVTNIPLLLFQIATTNNTILNKGNIPTNILQPLIEKLILHYGAGHEVIFVTSSVHIFMTAKKVKVKLKDVLDSNEIKLFERPTLYVPPLKELYKVEGNYRINSLD